MFFELLSTLLAGQCLSSTEKPGGGGWVGDGPQKQPPNNPPSKPPTTPKAPRRRPGRSVVSRRVASKVHVVAVLRCLIGGPLGLLLRPFGRLDVFDVFLLVIFLLGYVLSERPPTSPKKHPQNNPGVPQALLGCVWGLFWVSFCHHFNEHIKQS